MFRHDDETRPVVIPQDYQHEFEARQKMTVLQGYSDRTLRRANSILAEFQEADRAIEAQRR